MSRFQSGRYDAAPHRTDVGRSDMIDRTVVFDLDGTLAETAGDLMGALNHVLSLDGIAPLPVAQARNLLGAGGRALLQRGYATAGRSLDGARLEELFRCSSPITKSTSPIIRSCFPVPSRRSTASKRGAMPSRSAPTRSRRRRACCWRPWAWRIGSEAICGQDTFAVSKPQAGALLSTIALAGGTPERSVMVGDSVTDIMTAKAARIPVVAVDFGYTDKPVSELGPDRSSATSTRSTRRSTLSSTRPIVRDRAAGQAREAR